MANEFYFSDTKTIILYKYVERQLKKELKSVEQRLHEMEEIGN